MFWVIVSSIVAVFMATTMIFIRLKASRQPATVKKIILPPIFMSTGALMFIFPVFRVQWVQVVEALCVGIVFSIFLIKTSKFEIKDNAIFLVPSRAFVFILFGLLAVRIGAKTYLGSKISLGETSGMFFLLAFGMIVSWRIAMLITFKQLEKKLKKTTYQQSPHSH